MMSIQENNTSSRNPDRAVLQESEERQAPGGVVVVGIGISAGALEAFLKNLPETPDMAFTVVHLPLEYERLMASVLQPYTAVPPAQGNGSLQVETGHGYVIPPGSAPAERGLQHDADAGGLSGFAEAEAFIRQLEGELGRMKAHLLTRAEEREAANERMTVSNEEMIAINEKLTSAAEELEVSSEELRSANEELLAVNEELERKLEEINGINGDLLNLMNATEIGTIFLDGQLCIKRYTPPVADLFDIAAPDVGRPLAHLAHRLSNDTLPADAAEVLRGHVMVEREMQHTASRQWFLVRLRPYRTVEDSIAGVVITFTDITARKTYDEHLETLNHTLEARVAARVEQVRRLAAELVLAEHAERQRIAQILHDDLQQLLFALQVKLQVKVGRPGSTRLEEQAARPIEVNTLVARAIDVTRTLTAELSPAVLKGDDFAVTLDWLAVRMKDLHGLEVAVETERPVFLPLNLRALLYQLVRELLFNVVKHAGVDRACVTLVREESRLILRIEDEGAGFDLGVRQEQGPKVRGGFGLHSVGHRLSLLGGRLEMDTAPGKGARMIVYVPLGKDVPGTDTTSP